MNNNLSRLFKAAPATLLTVALLTACNGDSDSNPAPTPEPDRAHDARTFTPVEPTLTALTGASIYQGTHDGIHGPASYAIEVPTEGWNGILVMYAHGYRGTGEELTVSPPSRIRNYLISEGYAWAASSYSANYYDVRAGVEDTNALALAFEQLTNNTRGSPAKYYQAAEKFPDGVVGAPGGVIFRTTGGVFGDAQSSRVPLRPHGWARMRRPALDLPAALTPPPPVAWAGG